MFDPKGDQVGRVRDVVVVAAHRPRAAARARPRRRGPRPPPDLRADEPGHRASTPARSSPPAWSTCAASSSAPAETLVLGELLDRKVTLRRGRRRRSTVVDVAMEQQPHPRLGASPGVVRARRRRQAACAAAARRCTVDWDEVERLLPARGAARAPPTCSPPSSSCAPPTSPTCCTTCRAKRRARGRRRPRRRAARRRARGAARGRPGRDPRRARGRARRRRPRGDGSPTTPPTCSPSCRRTSAEQLLELMEPDEADAGAPAARLRRRHRRRPDDDRAGDPAAGRDGRRGAGPRPQPRPARPRSPRRSTSCRPPTGDADRPLPRHRALPAAAARAAVDAGRRGVVDTDLDPLAPGRAAGRGHPLPRDVQPGRGAGRRRATTTCSARSPSTTCSTTCCPRTGASATAPTARACADGA